MPRTKKPEAIASFKTNMADAEALVTYARHFTNQRVRSMRKELRSRVGDALRIPQRDQDNLDCIESDGLFVVFKPEAGIHRQAFADLRPLLRQAIVAGSAAFETYVADKAMEYVGPALRSDDPPPRLKEIPLTVGYWIDIHQKYARRGWGLRRVVEDHIREVSSVSPSQVGLVLSSVGVSNWATKVDAKRGVKRGETIKDLENIAKRRNRIAHSGDRVGQGRAQLEIDEVEGYLAVFTSVTDAIEQIMIEHSV
jgi:hypothetical protein